MIGATIPLFRGFAVSWLLRLVRRVLRGLNQNERERNTLLPHAWLRDGDGPRVFGGSAAGADYGVGIVAFGNLTYTGWGRTAATAFDVLAKTGGLHLRMPTPSPALNRARDAVSRLIVQWDDRLADDIAAENFFLDQSKERRRAELAGLKGTYGACNPADGFDFVENALRGRWTMNCEKGKLSIAITLAPTMPPKVQFLSVRPALAQTSRVEACPE